MNKQEYSHYLMSPEWKLRRKRRIKIDRFKCKECGSKDSLQVHHLTYERVGNEWMQDLKTLCRSCHEDVHKEDIDKKVAIDAQKNRLKYHCYHHPSIAPYIQAQAKNRGYIATAICYVCDREINKMREKDLNNLADIISKNQDKYSESTIDNLMAQIYDCIEAEDIEEFEIDDPHNPMYFEPPDDWEGVDYHST